MQTLFKALHTKPLALPPAEAERNTLPHPAAVSPNVSWPERVFPGSWFAPEHLRTCDAEIDPHGCALFDHYAWGSKERKQLIPQTEFARFTYPRGYLDKESQVVVFNSAKLNGWKIAPHKDQAVGTTNVTPTLGDLLLYYAKRYHADQVWQVLNVVDFRSKEGHGFSVVTLGSKSHDRLGHWKDLYKTEPVRITEFYAILDTNSGVAVGGVLLSFSIDYKKRSNWINSRIRISGLGNAPCGINNSFGILDGYRNRGAGKLLITMAIERGLDLLSKQNGVIANDIDTGLIERHPVCQVFEAMGATTNYGCGHGGLGVEKDSIRREGFLWLNEVKARFSPL